MRRLLRLFFMMILVLAATVQVQAADIITAKGNPRRGEWLCFQKRATLRKAVSSAPLRIAADSKYILIVNGDTAVRYGGLKRGPNPDDTYIDTLHLKKLRAGINIFTVLVWYFGDGGFSHRPSKTAGLFFDLDAGGVKIESDTTWYVREHKAMYVPLGEKPNSRLAENNIGYNAAADTVDICGVPSPADGWEKAVRVSPGYAKWGQFAVRPIPAFRDGGVKNFVSQHRSGNRIYCYLPYDAQVSPSLTVRAPEGKVIGINSDTYQRMKPELGLRYEYRTKDGLQTFEFPGWISGNTIIYNIPAGVEVVKLSYRESGYDCSLAGSFECNDRELTSLWRKAQRTLYLNMRDNFSDCPDRERAQYPGDASICFQLIPYALSQSSYSLMKKCISEFFAWQRDDSVLYGPVPSGTWSKELPQQSLAFIAEGLRQYYAATGDIATVKAILPGAWKYLSLWHLEADGMPEYRCGSWDWGDWGSPVDLHALGAEWYAMALTTFADLSDATGDSKGASAARLKRDLVAKAFNKNYLKKKGYIGSASLSTPDDRAQGLAIVAGIAPDSVLLRLKDILTTRFTASPYMEMYALRGLCEGGWVKEALDRMRTRYKAMADSVQTTLWELFEQNSTSSLNHAWSGAPLYILSRYVAGIAPVKPGFREFVVRPELAGLRYVRTTVPSPSGNIRMYVSAERGFLLKLDVPKKSKAYVFLPAKYREYHINGLSRQLALSSDTTRYEVVLPAGTYRIEALDADEDTAGVKQRLDSAVTVLRLIRSAAAEGNGVGMIPKDKFYVLMSAADSCLDQALSAGNVVTQMFALRDVSGAAADILSAVTPLSDGKWYTLKGRSAGVPLQSPGLPDEFSPASILWRASVSGNDGSFSLQNVVSGGCLETEGRLCLFPAGKDATAIYCPESGKLLGIDSSGSLTWHALPAAKQALSAFALDITAAGNRTEVYSTVLQPGAFSSLCMPFAIDSIGSPNIRLYSVTALLKDVSGEVTGLKLRRIKDAFPLVGAGYPIIVRADTALSAPVRLSAYSCGGADLIASAGNYNGLSGVFSDITAAGDDTLCVTSSGLRRTGRGVQLRRGSCMVELRKVRTVSSKCDAVIPLLTSVDAVSPVANGSSRRGTYIYYTTDGVRLSGCDLSSLERKRVYISGGRKFILY